MSSTDLILFSGGPDSTILLKHFLEQKKKVRVLYIEMGWALRERPKIKHQNIAVDNILSYMKNKYGHFEYSQASIFTSLDEESDEKYFAKDHQWCAFFGSMFCNNYNIKRMWTGHFSYTYKPVESGDYLNGKDLQFWMRSATKFLNEPPEYCTPRLMYKGKGLDKFKNVKEAWDSLDIELKKMVRSCISDKWYCGKCIKCETSVEHGLRDEKGMPL